MPTAPPDERPSRAEVIAAVVGTVIRLVLCFVFIAALLAIVPDDPDGRFALPIGIAIVASALYIWFFRRQLKVVYHARFPTLRAAEALILVAAMFLAIFSMFYVMISLQDPTAFTEELAPFNSYYFSLTVLATVGFGDITPVTTAARSVTMVQMSLDLAFIAIVIRVIGGAARHALDTRRQQPALPTTAEALED